MNFFLTHARRKRNPSLPNGPSFPNFFAPSFPNFIWERLLLLAKFHFALTHTGIRALKSVVCLPQPARSQMKFGNEGLVFLLLTSSFFLLPFSLPADTSDADLDAANHAYTSGSYDESAKLFQKIITERGYSAPLCYNLANAEARSGHPGLAMLNYERARYLAPGDADIDHNLQLARKQAGLEPNSYRWWQIVLLSINWTVWLGLISTCLVLLLLALIGTSWKIGPPALRPVCKGIFFVCIPLALLFGFVELACVGFNNRIEGVIVAPKEATLRQSPFESSDNIGTIPEGELVTVEDRHNDYFRIEARGDHHFGWVQAKEIEPVCADGFSAPPSN